MGVGYRITCNTCGEAGITKTYEGESGDSGRKRGLEHQRLWNAKDPKSVMHIHDMTDHNGRKAEYKMDVLKKFPTAFERQNNKPITIKLTPPESNINSKT